MRSTLKGLTARFSRDEKGATLVEYGVAVVLAVIVGTGGLIGKSGQRQHDCRRRGDDNSGR